MHGHGLTPTANHQACVHHRAEALGPPEVHISNVWITQKLVFDRMGRRFDTAEVIPEPTHPMTPRPMNSLEQVNTPAALVDVAGMQRTIDRMQSRMARP